MNQEQPCMRDVVNDRRCGERQRIRVMPDKEILMYAHAGSGNHGCEAIVRSICGILGDENRIALISNDADEDRRYGMDKVCRLIQERRIGEKFLTHAFYYAMRKVTGNGENFLRYRYADAEPFKDHRVAVSIGGDNYCYDSMISDLENANRMFHSKGLKTVLLGCSIEPDLIIKRKDIRYDMALYNKVIARESITYKALIDAGLTNAVECPDPAFALETAETDMPKGFIYAGCSGMVGINVSPMVQDCAGKDSADIVMHSYENLIEYILKETDMNIALIPHVVWERNDDRIPLKTLNDKYSGTGRVIMVSDRSCGEMKTVISRCRFFVGARTHATIAAYSTCVPTLVLGYSVKSRGIAKDLFGTDEDYVIPVQNMKSDMELVEGFEWLCDHEENIKDILAVRIPEYVGKTAKLKEYITTV